MPSVPVLLEVIGGERVLATVDPGHAASRTAEVLAQVVGKSLLEDDGRPRAWKLYAPNEQGGFDQVPAASNLLPIAMRMRRAQQQGADAGFGGPGEHEGQAFLFRLRLFIPVRPPSTGTTSERIQTIPDDEAVDLTNLDDEPVSATSNEGGGEMSKRPRAPKKRRPPADKPAERPSRRREPEEASGPVSGTAPALGPVAPFIGPDPTRERVAIAAPSLEKDGSLRAGAGTPYASGDTVLIQTVEARPVPAGSIGPEPERAQDAPKRAASVRAPTPKPARPKKRSSAPWWIAAILASVVLVGVVVFAVVRSRGAETGPAEPAAPTPAARRAAPLLDDLRIGPYPGLSDPQHPVAAAVAAYSALGLRARADTEAIEKRPRLLELKTELEQHCSRLPEFEGCDALAVVALAAAHACRSPGCPEPAARLLEISARAVESEIGRADTLVDGPTRQDAVRRSALNAIRISAVAPGSVGMWAPAALRIAKKACSGQPAAAATPECAEVLKIP